MHLNSCKNTKFWKYTLQLTWKVCTAFVEPPTVTVVSSHSASKSELHLLLIYQSWSIHGYSIVSLVCVTAWPTVCLSQYARNILLNLKWSCLGVDARTSTSLRALVYQVHLQSHLPIRSQFFTLAKLTKVPNTTSLLYEQARHIPSQFSALFSRDWTGSHYFLTLQGNCCLATAECWELEEDAETMWHILGDASEVSHWKHAW